MSGFEIKDAIGGRRGRLRTAACVSGSISLLFSIFLVSGCHSESPSDSSVGTQIDSALVAERIAENRRADIGEAYQLALDEVDPFIRHMLLASVYGRVDESNFAEFRTTFERDIKRRNARQAEVFGNLWAKADPQDALRNVLAWEDRKAQKFASEEILSVLVQGPDPRSTLRTLRSLSSEFPPGVLKQGEESLAEALGRNQILDVLLELLQGVEDADQRSRLIILSLIEITRADRGAFVRWVEQVKDDRSVAIELRYQLVMQAVRILVARDVEEALAWYPTIANEEYVGDALTAIAKRWGKDDPVAAMEFMRQRPESENPGSAKRAAAYLWLQKDPATARVELKKAIDLDPTMTSVIFPLVQYLMVSEVSEAMELAQQEENLEEREALLKQGLARMLRTDPAGLKIYLAKYDVSPAVRKFLRVARSYRASQGDKTETP